MAQEYKVYFDNRKIVLALELNKHHDDDDVLIVKVDNKSEIPKLVHFFQTSLHIQNMLLYGLEPADMLKALKSEFKVVEAAGGKVVNRNGELLMILRNGLWDLPKGKVDKNESIQEAALREVSEECGVNSIRIKRPLNCTYHTYNQNGTWHLKRTHWFEMIFFGVEKPTPQVEEGIVEVRWVSASDIKSYLENAYSSIKEVLREAGFA